MTVNGLLPSHHHAHRDEHSPRSNSTSSVCASKKNETSLIMMVGLVAMVLVSTQSVLSAIATQSSSQKLVVDGLNYIHDVQQQQQPSTTIDMSHHPLPTDGASRTPAAPSPPSSSKRTTSVVLQEIGWMQAVVEYRVKMANIAYEMEQRRRNHEKEILQEAARGNYTMDISPLYDLVSEMVDVIGVRGIIFDCLSSDYDYFLYYPEKPSSFCTHNHGVGDCLEHEAWWYYHYTGAIIADKFLRDGKGKILWDGVTGQYIDNFSDLIEEIQRFQQLPRVNEASFHVEHALLWHFFASVMPDVSEYPSEVADSLCRWNSHVREHGIKGRGVGKGLTHECYHGIGHAAFYVVAKRQARKFSNEVASKKAIDASVATFNNSNFRSTAMALQKLEQNKESGIETATRVTAQVPATDLPPLFSKKNGTIVISTAVAIELAKATADISSARIQFRPNIGFELTPDSMCEVYHFCKGAARKSDAHFNDLEKEYPFSHGIRVCLEGVVHSVRLFSTDRHDKKETINYVTKNMQRCQADEMSEEQSVNNQLATTSHVGEGETSSEIRIPGNVTAPIVSTEATGSIEMKPSAIVSTSSPEAPIREEEAAEHGGVRNPSALHQVVEATTRI